MPKKEKQILARLKIWLFKGKSITSNQALALWKTNKLPEYIRRLRNKGIKIYTEMKLSNSGDVYGQYSIKKPKKIFFQ